MPFMIGNFTKLITSKAICIINHEVFKMSDKKTVIGDDMVEVKLRETSDKLNISVKELIERYIKRGLFSDDYYVHRDLSREELVELSKRDIERDKKKGILPQKHDFSVFINLFDDD